MKNLFAMAFAAALAFTFAACSNDDDNGPAGDEIVGTWALTDIDYSGTSTTSSPAGAFTADFTGSGYDMDVTVTFEEDPNVYKTDGDYSIELVTEFNDQTFESQVENEGFIDDGEWERNGDTITITNSDGETTTSEIVSINASSMVIAYDFVRVTTENGATVEYSVNGTYSFDRQ